MDDLLVSMLFLRLGGESNTISTAVCSCIENKYFQTQREEITLCTSCMLHFQGLDRLQLKTNPLSQTVTILVSFEILERILHPLPKTKLQIHNLKPVIHNNWHLQKSLIHKKYKKC